MGKTVQMIALILDSIERRDAIGLKRDPFRCYEAEEESEGDQKLLFSYDS